MASPSRRLVRHVRLACLLFSVFISTCVSASAVLAAPGISIGSTDTADRGRFAVHVLRSLRGSWMNAFGYLASSTPTTPLGVAPTGRGVPTAPGTLTAAGGPAPVVAAVRSYINPTFLTSHTTAPFDSSGGDLILVCASSHIGVTFTPTDSFGNTWIPIAGPTNTTFEFDLRTAVWYARNPIVGQGHTVTMGLSASQPLVISVFVVKGASVSSPIAAVTQIGSDSGTQTTSVASPGITTTAANELLIGFAKVSAGATFASGAGFTEQPAASSNFLDAETGVAPTPGNYAATFTINSAQTWQSAVVAAAPDPNQSALSWSPSTESGGSVSTYLVERCQGAGCDSFSQIGTTAGTTFNDTNLAPSTTYNYRVRAKDTAKNIGPYSNVVTFTTPATIPSVPGNLTATAASSRGITVSWIASAENGRRVSGYSVERCRGANCTNFAQIGTAVGTTFNDSSLANATNYTYRIRAIDAAGNASPYSNLAANTTLRSGRIGFPRHKVGYVAAGSFWFAALFGVYFRKEKELCQRPQESESCVSGSEQCA